MRKHCPEGDLACKPIKSGGISPTLRRRWRSLRSQVHSTAMSTGITMSRYHDYGSFCATSFGEILSWIAGMCARNTSILVISAICGYFVASGVQKRTRRSALVRRRPDFWTLTASYCNSTFEWSFRISRADFENLLHILIPYFSKRQEMDRRGSSGTLDPANLLGITLRTPGGASYLDLMFIIDVPKSTFCKVFHKPWTLFCCICLYT